MEYKNHIRKRHWKYKIEMQQMIDDDPQQFFKHVKYSTNQSSDFPRTMLFKETANLFRDFFDSVYCKPVDNATQRYDRKCMSSKNVDGLCANIPPITITEHEVLNQLKCLPNNLVAGPDNIPNIFLRRCAPSIAVPISKLLQESLSKGVIPLLWKSYFVYPIFKN